MTFDIAFALLMGGFGGYFCRFLLGWMNAFDSGDADKAFKYMFRPRHNLKFQKTKP